MSNVAYLTRKTERIDRAALDGCQYIVSFGYRYILPSDIVQEYAGRAFNIHVGFLPFNRGASPNLWAWHDSTPHGVTLHLIDSGVDTGRWICRQPVSMRDIDTLATSYRRLTEHGMEMLRSWLPRLVRGDFTANEYSATGTYHTKAESETLFQTLPLGWETPANWFRRAA